MSAPIPLPLARRPRSLVGRLYLGMERGVTALVHMRTLLVLWQAPTGSTLAAQVAARPEVWHLLQAPFVHAHWTTAERYHRLIDHCRIVERLGLPFNLLPNQYADVLELVEIGSNYRLMLDSPRWLFRDGLLALSLWEGSDRLFSLAFVLSTERDGMVAYVGGVQGRRGGNALDQYRAFTKCAEGMRPRDLLIELFRSVCAYLGVARIRCVSNGTRHQRAAYFMRRDDYYDPVMLDYDAMWIERGGRLGDDGFFQLPVIVTPRPIAAIPTRKRALHRRRRAMLGSIRKRMDAALTRPATIGINQHEPTWL